MSPQTAQVIINQIGASGGAPAHIDCVSNKRHARFKMLDDKRSSDQVYSDAFATIGRKCTAMEMAEAADRTKASFHSYVGRNLGVFKKERKGKIMLFWIENMINGEAE